MAAQLDEHTQYTDDGGNPLVNGLLYIGLKGSNPKTNLITIYSDRELTSVLSNPQTLDADGRATNKIWIPGEYSIRVEDLNNVQEYQNLDAGEEASSGITTLSNVIGVNALTAEAPSAISAYTDTELYIFKAVSLNTGAMTIKIDSAPIVDIKKNLDQDVAAGQVKVGQMMVLAYNSTTGDMAWLNENTRVRYGTEGAAIASAATVDLSLATGNLIHITGNTTITSFGTGSVPAGTEYILVFDSNPQVTHGASLLMPGDTSRVMVPGTVMRVNSEGSDVFRITNIFLDEPQFANYPTGYIDGLQISNGTDATNDIDIAAGHCRDTLDAFNMNPAGTMTKQIDANWAEGSAVGGFPSGLTLTNDTTYHMFLLKRSDTGNHDAGFDTSLTATNLLADATNYDSYRRIGSILYGTATIEQFVQDGDEFVWDVVKESVADSATSTTQILSVVDVPIGIKVDALLILWMNPGSGQQWLVQDPALTDTAPATTAYTMRAGGQQVAIANVRTDTSGQVAERGTATFTRQILTKGWIDRRGKN